MREKAGQWFIVEGLMNQRMVNQVLEFQRHGDRHKFGEIALARHLINGKSLKRYLHTIY